MRAAVEDAERRGGFAKWSQISLSCRLPGKGDRGHRGLPRDRCTLRSALATDRAGPDPGGSYGRYGRVHLMSIKESPADHERQQSEPRMKSSTRCLGVLAYADQLQALSIHEPNQALPHPEQIYDDARASSPNFELTERSPALPNDLPATIPAPKELQCRTQSSATTPTLPPSSTT
jgi:hypothetical protein